MSLIKELNERGLIQQISADAELEEHLASGMRTIYGGFDPTAESLHIGNLVLLLLLRRFQQAGHRPILLVGGATGMIGDPGGRDSERELQTAEVVQRQLDKIREQAKQFVEFDCGENSAVLVNNADWTQDMTVIDFLRDVGKHFSVNAMIQKESVRRRIEDDSQGISYTEFSYMVLQSYDYVVLNQKYGCTIQAGGSDQWGNITAGIDLNRRMGGPQTYAVTTPLITKSDGTKFGKSSGGAIWLSPEMTSPYSFYQFWLNTADADVMNYIKIFTFFPEEEMQRLAESQKNDPGKREAQRAIANDLTELVHGPEGVEAAQRITGALFGNRLDELSESDLEQLRLDGMESSKEAGEPGLIDVLVSSGLAVTPKGEVTQGQARKLIQGNGVSVNGEKITDVEAKLTPAAALRGKYFIVQKGKKNHHLVVVE